MSSRIAIRHRSGYRYVSDVYASYNEARLTPRTTDRQLVLDARVEVSPAAHFLPYTDYWGTVVHAFELHEPHRELVVTGTALVETSDPPPVASPAGWSGFASLVADRFVEFLGATSYTAVDDRLADVARRLAASADGPAAAMRAAEEWVRDVLTYAPGATHVTTSALEARDAGRGVCQDFAHLTVALLRAMGVPARYVSGYLHPDPRAVIGETVQGESHAWVDAWVGGWVPLDPTNGVAVGERHVTVARGRDYADVAPLKGIIQGGPAEALGVTVELTRIA